MRFINTICFRNFLLVLSLMATNLVHAQCGVTMSCAGPPKACVEQVCFKNDASKLQYEQQNNYKFANKELCGDKPLDAATQCCGKDAKSGDAKIKSRQITQLDSNFDWASYQKECANMRQSEGKPDGLWAQCVIGKRQDPATDDWPILTVQKNFGNSNARPYCVDGCSTPRSVVNSLYNFGVFLVEDKENPSGFPGASFVGACSTHDVCYQTCGPSYDQDSCDNKLLSDSLHACEVIPRNHVSIDSFGDSRNTFAACRNAANKMNTGLQVGGKKAFSTRKQQYCQCC